MRSECKKYKWGLRRGGNFPRVTFIGERREDVVKDALKFWCPNILRLNEREAIQFLREEMGIEVVRL